MVPQWCKSPPFFIYLHNSPSIVLHFAARLICLKHSKLLHSSVLNLLWFPIAFIIKPKFLHMSHQPLRSLTPGPLTACIPHSASHLPLHFDPPAFCHSTHASGSFPGQALCILYCLYPYFTPSLATVQASAECHFCRKLPWPQMGDSLPSLCAFILPLSEHLFLMLTTFSKRQEGNGSGLFVAVSLEPKMMYSLL